MDLRINTIYLATEGEGIFVGTPQVFVRFQGCTVGCINCDSKETWDFTEEFMSLEHVMALVNREAGHGAYKIKRVSITGGDPLHPKNVPGVMALTERLKAEGYYVNIEAAGTRVVKEVFDAVDFVSFDFKTPSTAVKTSLQSIKRLLKDYGQKSQIKSVIQDKKDFEFTFDAYTKVSKEESIAIHSWVLTPCFEPGEEFPQDRFSDIMDMNHEFGAPFRVIGQQHKWIFGAETKNV